jgi:hypothetical protein
MKKLLVVVALATTYFTCNKYEQKNDNNNTIYPSDTLTEYFSKRYQKR